jgi:hypothetical protein
MTSKRKSKPKTEPYPDQLTVFANPGDNDELAMARFALGPTVQAATTLKGYDKKYGDLNLQGLIDALQEQTKASKDGDINRAETMLTAQAHTLDAIFNNLARRAVNAEYLNNLDIFLKLALRAQSQWRSTWEALSAIKNPPVMGYVRQANIANGPQQVNNGVPGDESRARKNQNQENKLMEQKDGERMDIGTTGKAGKADPAMATVGEVDGAEDKGR